LDLNFDLNLVQSQKLLLTPKIKQVLEVLKMSSQELFEYVEEQLETNPVLEIVDNEESFIDEDYSVSNNNEIWEHNEEENEDTEPKYKDKEWLLEDTSFDNSFIKLTLKDHLLFQLHTSSLEKNQISIGEYIIDNLDDNGYLSIDITEVAAYFNTPVNKVSKVLTLLQAFDPPGICARSLKECILIQLKLINRVDNKIIDLIENHLDALATKKFIEIAKQTEINVKKIEETFELIKTIEPKPGREFSTNNEIKYTIPDVIIKRIKNKCEVIINEDSIPLLNISSYYKRMENDETNYEAKKFIQGKIDSASWLISCIEQRKSTIRKIAEYIVSIQTEFLEKGKNFVKAIPLKAIAQQVNMHESTISRIIGGKYIQCTWGIFEFRYFIK